MNYRHAYHAGNFADVLKHLVLTLVIEHLKQKPAPFRVIDTHAGTGLYDLTGIEAQKTGEWLSGIGRIRAEPFAPEVAEIIAPYLACIQTENPDGTLARYPGSPLIARSLMRENDVLVVNELHPQDHAELAGLFARDAQTKVLHLDGWTALKSLLPPKERRGVILVDPPFEEAGELDRLVTGLKDVERRFATGTVILWYPIKAPRALDRFYAAIAALNLEKILVTELFIREPTDPGILNGTGLVVFNPPFTLAGKLRTALPALTSRLAYEPGALHVLDTRCPPARP
ncbi:MAG: 23S rRNA (adenine(2030)-N(6))-methyltransferase RlmJ [Hyphomicrobium sp. 32-62-53]|nr:MAG: 23S rRNA (adenine(2030)-N(6))-methyltransferase RlmJ [Hyphomicrobium sp. 12-62-95]OYX99402.1 MAG: 23S rRNA (adenine(2030)-N(6))-methyltransferase RlmJ [Hyphomicrobium sp. 32-62-53]